jgi:uroporphyrinogen-III synthase
MLCQKLLSVLAEASSECARRLDLSDVFNPIVHGDGDRRVIGTLPLLQRVDALLALITKYKPSNLLHIRGAHSRGDLTARLTQAGLNARDHVLYDQLQMPLNAEARALLFGPDTVIMPLFSPRSAALVAQQLSGSSRGPMTGRHIALCLSQNVASACGEGIFGSIEICAAPNAASMVAHLETYAAE